MTGKKIYRRYHGIDENPRQGSITAVNDTGDLFIAGSNNTGDNLSPVSLKLVKSLLPVRCQESCEYLRQFSYFPSRDPIRHKLYYEKL